MFTGENRQTLQTLIDNNTITAADQQTSILALKAIQTAIKDKEHIWHCRGENSATMATNSATMATRSSTKCPWRKILQTRNQIHEHPTYRSMQTSGKNCQTCLCRDTSLCQPHSGPWTKQEIYKTDANHGTAQKDSTRIQAAAQREQPIQRQLTQIQHTAQKQKAVTPHRPKTLNFHHYRTIPKTLQDHPPAASLLPY